MCRSGRHFYDVERVVRRKRELVFCVTHRTVLYEPSNTLHEPSNRRDYMPISAYSILLIHWASLLPLLDGFLLRSHLISSLKETFWQKCSMIRAKKSAQNLYKLSNSELVRVRVVTQSTRNAVPGWMVSWGCGVSRERRHKWATGTA